MMNPGVLAKPNPRDSIQPPEIPLVLVALHRNPWITSPTPHPRWPHLSAGPGIPCGAGSLYNQPLCPAPEMAALPSPPAITPALCLPVEDVWKNEGERTVLTCRVQFQTPPDVRHNWKFVKDLRTRDLSLFRDLHPGASSSIVLRPTRGSHRGTYACQLAQEDDVLARNYFYLNVTASSQGAETELQDMFRAILQSPAGRGAEGRLPGLSELLAEPNSLHKRNVVLLMVGLALSALLGTLLLGGVCRWAMGWP
nr:sperm acrosome membrane-associated protein 6 isoform X2 [Chrysemys picta bellii]